MIFDGERTHDITISERRRLVTDHVAEDRRDCCWLYVVTDCASEPRLQDPVRDPARFPCHEVTNVQHYWPQVQALASGAGIR